MNTYISTNTKLPPSFLFIQFKAFFDFYMCYGYLLLEFNDELLLIGISLLVLMELGFKFFYLVFFVKMHIVIIVDFWWGF